MLLDLWPLVEEDAGSTVGSVGGPPTTKRRVTASVELVWEVRSSASAAASTAYAVVGRATKSVEVAAEVRSPLCIHTDAAWSVRIRMSAQAGLRWKRSPSWQRAAAWAVHDEAELLVALDLI